MKLEVEEVMRRVREEVARRQAGTTDAIGSSTSQAELTLPAWAPALPPVPIKSEYTSGELLVPSDRAFVDSAYLTVLQRPADPEGLAFYVQKLRSGALSKIEVLAQLRWSPEGRERGVHVDGLLAPAKLHQWRRKRVLGPLISWAHAVFRLPTLAARFASSEAIQAGEIEELGQLLNRVSAQMDARVRLVETAQATIMDKLQSFENKELELAASAEARLTELQCSFAAEQVKFAAYEAGANAQHEVLAADLNLQRSQVAVFEAAIKAQQEALATDLTWQRGQLAAHGAALADIDRAEELAQENSRALDPLYVAFEEQFRGPRELIRERALPYIDIVRAAGAGTPEAPVLDLGCGRGDWLDVLREHSLVARGVDSNRVFLDLCRGRGLEVIDGDVLEVLRGIGDASVGAITGMHIAEHLPFEILVALLDEARRVLRVGGVLALETPNPENLWVASHWFYMDPTHRNPLPPEALRWIVEARGFADARIERWTVGRPSPAPPLLGPEMPGAASVNVLLGQLHASLDYAIIARRIQ